MRSPALAFLYLSAFLLSAVAAFWICLPEQRSALADNMASAYVAAGVLAMLAGHHLSGLGGETLGRDACRSYAPAVSIIAFSVAAAVLSDVLVSQPDGVFRGVPVVHFLLASGGLVAAGELARRFARSSHAGIHGRPYWRAKRAIDLGVAVAALVVLLPVLAIVAAAILLRLGRPVIFSQHRPGRRGRSFRILKFRTMRASPDPFGRTLTDDERTCVLGRFLRRARLDELPQLVNVLRGEMSLIGPRPLLPRDQIAADARRLAVRPGLTGWAQIAGGRAISASEKAALDIWYVDNAGLWLDLRIALRTVPMLLFGDRVDRATVDWTLAQAPRAGLD